MGTLGAARLVKLLGELLPEDRLRVRSSGTTSPAGPGGIVSALWPGSGPMSSAMAAVADQLATTNPGPGPGLVNPLRTWTLGHRAAGPGRHRLVGKRSP